MSKRSSENKPEPVRVGAVAYLNARPLTVCLEDVARRMERSVEVTFDLPSRLADGLAAGELDVALVPSIEYPRQAGSTVVSDACVSCNGPVRSVKLCGRVPVEAIRSVALDEGSRTSAAMTRILLAGRFGLEPQLRQLPIGASPEDVEADAVMLIGDRGMHSQGDEYAFVWDLGEEWVRWTGLPFVFAMWVARPGVESWGLGSLLAAARDEGVRRLAQIARTEAPNVGLPELECLSYLHDNLVFSLGSAQKRGLEKFYRLAGRYGLAPTGVELVFSDREDT